MYIYIYVYIYIYTRTVPASHSPHDVKGATEVVRAAQRLHAARPYIDPYRYQGISIYRY